MKVSWRASQISWVLPQTPQHAGLRCPALSFGFNLQSILNSSPSLLMILPQHTFRISRSISEPVRSARLLGSFLCSFGRCSACSLCGELLACAQPQALSCPLAPSFFAASHVSLPCCSHVLYLSLRSVSLLCFAHLAPLAQFAVALCGHRSNESPRGQLRALPARRTSCLCGSFDDQIVGIWSFVLCVS